MAPPATSPSPFAVAIDESGFRHDWLAAQLGVSKATFSRWYRGRLIPSESDRERLALLLRREIGELFPNGQVAA